MRREPDEEEAALDGRRGWPSAVSSPTPSTGRIGWANVHMLGFLNREGLAVDNRVYDLPTPALKQPLHGSSGDLHLLCGLLLMHAVEIAERKSLQLVEADLHEFCLRERDPGWLEEIESSKAPAVARFLRAWHAASIERNGCRSKWARLLDIVCICI